MKIAFKIFTIFCLIFGHISAVPTSPTPKLYINDELNTETNDEPMPEFSPDGTEDLPDTSTSPSTTSPKTTPSTLAPTTQAVAKVNITTSPPSTAVTTVRTTTLSPEQKCYQYCTNVTNDLKEQYETEIDSLKNIVIDLMEKRCELNRGKWVSAENGTIPKGGIVSGWDPDRPYWVARAYTGCSVVPCKLTKVHATCWMAWNNTEIRMNKYEVLVDADVKWVQHSSNNPLPKKALIAGHYLNSEGISEKLYVARAYIAEFLVPGYVYEFSRELRHSTRFKNEIKTSYEILVNL